MRAGSCFFALIFSLAGIASAQTNGWVFSGVMPGGHREPVSAIIHKGNTILSAGEDGFLEIWNVQASAASGRGNTRTPGNTGGGNTAGNTGGNAVERFQISPYRIVAMVERPDSDEVCVLENDNLGLHRVSVWNYRERRNKFTLQFRDPISHISYSMGGNFIIAARAGRTGLVLVDSNSGELLQSPEALTGTAGLAATGRSERNMLVYLTSGILSYWDLGSKTETSRFDAPANLNSPVLFSNSRYIAGLNAEGLLVVHAVSGEVAASDDSIPAGSLLYPAGDNFFCLVQNDDSSAGVYRYTIDRTGQLVKLGGFDIPALVSGEGRRFTAFAASVSGTATTAGSVSIALGTRDGTLILAGMDGRLRPLTIKEQTHITEAAVSGSTIAFLTEDGTLGFIPLNYTQISTRTVIPREKPEETYNRITAFAGANGGAGRFIFWQDQNTRTQPVIRSSATNDVQSIPGGSRLRSPIRSVSSFGGKIMFVDTSGNLSVISPFDGDASPPFTFFSVGLMDAAFIDNDRIILGRSAVSGNTPFLIINIKTGETVPLSYPVQAGVTLRRGESGGIYAVAISPTVNAQILARTSILRLNLESVTNSVRLVEFQEEDTQFSLTETAGILAATIGGEGAALYTASGIQALERTPGLPLKLIDGGFWLLSVDRDGNICWHDSSTGKLLAVFRLSLSGWALQTERGVINSRY